MSTNQQPPVTVRFEMRGVIGPEEWLADLAEFSGYELLRELNRHGHNNRDIMFDSQRRMGTVWRQGVVRVGRFEALRGVVAR